jgi:hypothetical protein
LKIARYGAISIQEPKDPSTKRASSLRGCLPIQHGQQADLSRHQKGAFFPFAISFVLVLSAALMSNEIALKVPGAQGVPE